MALSFRRRGIAPMPRRNPEMAVRSARPQAGTLSDDYLVEGEDADDRPSAGARIVHGLQLLLILVIGVLSLAVFWVAGTMLNIL